MDDADLIAQVLPLSKQSPERLLALVRALRDLDRRDIAGAVVECGVWRGASAIIAKTVSPERTCWLYDTFDGMTAPDPVRDISHLGRSAADSYRFKAARGEKWSPAPFAEVMGNLARFGITSGVEFVVGDVEITLTARRPRLPERIALLRLDTDFYASTKVELAVLYPRLQHGGVLIVDDYGHWLGCRRAVNEFFNFHPLDIWHWSRFEQIDATAVMMVK
jgi:O-methyltransferase